MDLLDRADALGRSRLLSATHLSQFAIDVARAIVVAIDVTQARCPADALSPSFDGWTILVALT